MEYKRDELLGILNKVMKCVPSKAVIANLDNVCFSEKYCYGYNGVMAAICPWNDSKFVGGINGDRLTRFLNLCSSDTIKIDVSGNSCSVGCRTTKAKFEVIPVESFSFSLPDYKNLPNYKVTPDTKKSLIKSLTVVDSNHMMFSHVIIDRKRAIGISNSVISVSTLDTDFKDNLSGDFCKLMVSLLKDDEEADLFIGDEFFICVLSDCIIWCSRQTGYEPGDYDRILKSVDIENIPMIKIDDNFTSLINQSLVFINPSNSHEGLFFKSGPKFVRVTCEGARGELSGVVKGTTEQCSALFSPQDILKVMPYISEFGLTVLPNKTTVFVGKGDGYYCIVSSI